MEAFAQDGQGQQSARNAMLFCFHQVKMHGHVMEVRSDGGGEVVCFFVIFFIFFIY
jgi:hypothetical protein